MAGLRDSFDRRRPDLPAGVPFWKDRSFAQLLQKCPVLRPIETYLPVGGAAGAAAAPDASPPSRSSYRDHGYDGFFYALVRCLRPRHCVELGVLQGFSLLASARALRDNGAGRIEGYDLFEDYPYTNEPYAAVVERVRSAGLQDWAGVHRADADSVSDCVGQVDFLHVDLSNDGDRFRQVFENWSPKVTQVIVLEGGSDSRDQVEWMIRYRRPPIAAVINELRRSHPDWMITVLEPYPSLSVAVHVP